MKKDAVYLVSLGCPKNLVDSEIMLGLLTANGYGVATTPADADIILINTCSFIREATQEALDTIIEAAQFRKSGSCRLLVVTGCLPQRYGDELVREIPEVDLFLGTDQFHRVIDFLEPKAGDRGRLAVGRTGFLYDHRMPRLLSGPTSSAYIKIAEGCSRVCSFCIVPKLRGPYRSRHMSSVLEEAHLLVSQGVKEINLVAQDTTAYGRDLGNGATLAALLKRLSHIDGLEWIRLLYAYPEHFDSELLSQMARSTKICKYIDLPIQHVNGDVLRAMGRLGSRESLEALISRIREMIPDVCIRTTLMVGFPGETEAQFLELLDFVESVRFDRLGGFQFSAEEGTAAAVMKMQVPGKVKKQRWARLMEVQQRISLMRNQSLVGKTVSVLVEERLDKARILRGRMASQAPDIDGHVTIRDEEVLPGRIAHVLITAAHPYDLEGRMV